MTELILIRHGETDWNRELRFQGQVDVPLNATGHEQALRVARRLAGSTVHHIYCSDLLRTRETADPSATELALQLVPDAGLREQNFGAVDGMRVDDIKAQHAEAWDQWIRFDADYAFTGGESTRQFHTRVMQSLRRIAAAHPGQTLLVVTHGGVLDMVFRTARGLDLSGPRQSEIPNGGLNRVRLADDIFEILEWADTGHLNDMPPQPVYDQSKLAQSAAKVPSPSAA
jgi:2,3-bisphosphoglycerate-dependent phosphoglycerate mutase